MITQRQLRVFTLYTLLLFGIPTLLLLNGCAVSPSINPAKYMTPTGHHLDASPGMPEGIGFAFDESAYTKADIDRKKLQHDERWAAFWCDIGSTALAIGTGGGSELWGNASLLIKVPVSYVIERKLVSDAENGHTAGLGIVNTLHWGACLLNMGRL